MEGNSWFSLKSGDCLQKVTTFEYYGSPEDPDDDTVKLMPGDVVTVQQKVDDLLICITEGGTRFALSRYGIYTWELFAG